MLNWIKAEIRNERAYRHQYAPYQTVIEAACFAAVMMLTTALLVIA